MGCLGIPFVITVTLYSLDLSSNPSRAILFWKSTKKTKINKSFEPSLADLFSSVSGLILPLPLAGLRGRLKETNKLY